MAVLNLMHLEDCVQSIKDTLSTDSALEHLTDKDYERYLRQHFPFCWDGCLRRAALHVRSHHANLWLEHTHAEATHSLGCLNLFCRWACGVIMYTL